MEIFNIGPLELFFILILAVIIFGPQDMVKYSRKAGRWLYKMSKSELWQSVVGTSKEIKEFPRQIMKEAQIEESLNAIKSLNQSLNDPVELHPVPEKVETNPAEPKADPTGAETDSTKPKDDSAAAQPPA